MIRCITIWSQVVRGQYTGSKGPKIVPTIFITDLDGTLLGHDDFDFASIRADILAFLARGVAIIPNSSKTRQEIEGFCADLGVTLPFICENGAALVNADLLAAGLDPDMPRKIIAGKSVDQLMSDWISAVDPALRQHCVFVDAMQEADQTRILGLTGEALSRALAREFSVLFLFTGDEASFIRLRAQAAEAGLAVHRGGRVCCLSGRHDKSTFNQFIRGIFAPAPVAPQLIGFGDSENDVALLCAADVACVVPRPGAPILTLPDPPDKVIIAPQPAPSGWIIAANAAFAALETGTES